MPVTYDPQALPVVAGQPATRLPNRVPLTAVPLPDRLRTLLGLPFVVAGVFILVASTRRAGDDAPAWLLALIGALFLAVGLALSLSGLARPREQAVLRRRRADSPAEPWRGDYPWERRGGRDRAGLPVLGFLGGFAIVAVLATAFLWASRQDDAPGWLGFFGVAGALGAAALLAQLLRHAGRAVRWGGSRLSLAGMPWRPGAEVVLSLDGLAPRWRRVPMRATLRCIQEQWEAVPVYRGSGEQTSILYHALWSDARDLPAGAASVRFALPADAPGTHIAQRAARYWELELVPLDPAPAADAAPGAGPRAVFLVPVYAA